MFNPTLTDLVYQIKCGTKNGTAFLIAKNYALTVFHVVSEHETHDIKLSQNNKLIVKAKIISDDIVESKVMDFAILELEEDIDVPLLVMANCKKIRTGTKWTSRGYPKSKMQTGENIYQDDNKVHQHLSTLKNRKIDIELDHNLKWSSFEGISGAPLVIDNKIIGIINSELTEGHMSKELYALSNKYLKKTLQEKCGIKIQREVIAKKKGENIKPIISEPSLGQMKSLVEDYKKEVTAGESEFKELFDKISHFSSNVDAIKQELAEKLNDGGFEEDTDWATELKEAYTKRLLKNDVSLAQQKIHAFLLVKVQMSFRRHVLSAIRNGTKKEEIRLLIDNQVISKVGEYLGYDNVLNLYDDDINGMLYFLTGNCHIKWI